MVEILKHPTLAALKRQQAPPEDVAAGYWGVFNVGTDDEPILIIKRRVEVDRDDGVKVENFKFMTDAAAMIYVLNRACLQRCPEAREALKTIVASWDEE